MNTSSPLPDSVIILEKIGLKQALSIIIGISAGALIFLFWLIYFKGGSEQTYPWVGNLPIVNASFNTLSTIFLIMGIIQIRKKNFVKHMRFMLAAFVSSAFFLVSYVIYHNFAGHTVFGGEGFIKGVYLFILISHIILSAAVVPLILSSFYFALAGKLNTHRKVSKITFPIWLYVSVTGVIVFFMLRIWG
ncbi:MAG: DUF420 domain-containing protein [Bacteroidota bacterium]